MPNKSKNHTGTFVYYLLLCKIAFHLKIGPAKIRVAGPFPPDLMVAIKQHG